MTDLSKALPCVTLVKSTSLRTTGLIESRGGVGSFVLADLSCRGFNIFCNHCWTRKLGNNEIEQWVSEINIDISAVIKNLQEKCCLCYIHDLGDVTGECSLSKIKSLHDLEIFVPGLCSVVVLLNSDTHHTGNSSVGSTSTSVFGRFLMLMDVTTDDSVTWLWWTQWAQRPR